MSEPIPYQSMKCLKTIEDSDGIDCVAISPDGQTIVTSGITVKIRNTHTGEQVLPDLVGPLGLSESLAISPDGQILAKGGEDFTIDLWNLHTGEKLRTLNKTKEFPEKIRSIVISPDNVTLISGGDGGTADLWNLRTGKLGDLASSTGSLLALSSDGQLLVSSYLTTLEIVKFPQGGLVYRLRAPRSISAIAISRDRLLIVGAIDSTIKLWDKDTGQERYTLKGHSDDVSSLAVSPDGVTLICGSWDKTIGLWNLQTGELLGSLLGHPGRIYSVALSGDGRTLVSSSYGCVKVWGLP